ncbi:PqqD family protein [Micromonospora sp. ATCC 39149]|uniref:PqqD family protein n=1 Tax=Micromonospora sp. (strain ATCC 39149 / NRRL 15099 / SCC 1413) TaxID=219305 RepID=UPI0002F2C82A|nr:PqqD family protein [Micromonospora sp. ATCC 39149]
MLTTITLAAADEPTRGWGGPIALAIVAAAYIAGATLHDWWRRTRQDPSPTGDGDTESGVKPQVTQVSDTSDTDRDTGWWGRIVEVGGRRVRTADGPEPTRDTDVDLDLDGDDAEDEEDEAESIEDVIGKMLDRGHPYAEIVRSIMEEFEVSEATAKRRIRDVRAERIAAAS